MRELKEDKVILELDKYEYGVVFHSLKDKRNEMIQENRPTDAVDDLLLKVIDVGETLPECGRKEKKGWRCREAR